MEKVPEKLHFKFRDEPVKRTEIIKAGTKKLTSTTGKMAASSLASNAMHLHP